MGDFHRGAPPGGIAASATRAAGGCGVQVVGLLLVLGLGALLLISAIRAFDPIERARRESESEDAAQLLEATRDERLWRDEILTEAAGVAGAIIMVGGAVGLLSYGAVALHGLRLRWASDEARGSDERIAVAEAQHMQLPDGLHSLTIQAPRGREPLPVELTNPPIDVTPVPELPPPHERFVHGPSRIQQLVERGDIASDSDRLLVGYAGQQPVHMRAEEWGLAIVAGQSGKGKSSLAGLLIAQAALAGWAIIVCDPVYNRERSLLREYLTGISGAIWKQAVKAEEIAAAVAQAMRIAQKRLDTGAKGARVLLVMDEFASISGGKMLDETEMERLFLTATKSSGVGVHTLLIAHDLSGSWFGGQAARRGRDQATHRLICNMSPKAAEPVLPGSEYAQQVAMLPLGQALFFDGFTAPVVINFPRLSPADLAWSAKGKEPRPYAPWTPALIPPAPPSLPASATPAQLLPTTPIPNLPPRAAPPTVVLPPVPTPTIKERIVEWLRRNPGEHDHKTITAGISADEWGPVDEGSVNNMLGELRGEGTLSHRAVRRRFVYRLSPHALTV